MAELARRTTICEMRRAGNSVSDIIKSTGYAKSTVYRVVAAFDAEGKVQRSWHSPRSDQKRTKTFLAGLKRTLKAEPSQSMSKLAQKRRVSRSTISRAVKEDLGMKSYVRRCSFKTLRPLMEQRKFRISWRKIFLWWSRRIFGPAAPQIWMFVTIGCLATLRESLT